MLNVDLILQAVRDRQAALRARPPLLGSSRPGPARRRLGAWIVRLGLLVAGRPRPVARLA